MTNLRTLLVAAAACAVATPALAQFVDSTTPGYPNRTPGITVFGGGASLPAPTIRAAGNLFGDDLLLCFRGTGAPVQIANTNLSDTGSDGISYISTGSGRGILGFFSLRGDEWRADCTGGPVNAFTQDADFATSETALGQTTTGGSANGGTIDTYNNGGTVTQSGVTLSIQGANNPGGTLPNPRAVAGRAIQLPILIAPVAIAHDPVYKKQFFPTGTTPLCGSLAQVAAPGGIVCEYRFAQRGGSPLSTSGGINMNRDSLCNVFNGTARNWDQIADTSSTPRQDPSDPAPGDRLTSLPIEIVGRLDSSGTTSVFNRHLAAVCPGRPNVPTNNYTTAGTNLPAVLTTGGGRYDKAANVLTAPPVPGLFTLADGSDGIAEYLDFDNNNVLPTAANPVITSGKIAYLGTDWTIPGVQAQGTATSARLFNFDIQNRTGGYRSPSTTNAQAAYSVLQVPTGAQRANPAAGTGQGVWVQDSNPASLLADPDNPSPQVRTEYPIVGTNNVLLHTCYSGTEQEGRVADVLRRFFGAYYTDGTYAQLLISSGFAPLPENWRTAIVNTFFSPPTVADASLELTLQTNGVEGLEQFVPQSQCVPGGSDPQYVGPGA